MIGAVTGGTDAGDFAADFDDDLIHRADTEVLGDVVLASESETDSLASSIESTDSLPATGMFARYVPADLPGGVKTPVVGILAIVEMIVGALVASLRQIGGPVAAAGVYLAYSVWQHQRTKSGQATDV